MANRVGLADFAPVRADEITE